MVYHLFQDPILQNQICSNQQEDTQCRC